VIDQSIPTRAIDGVTFDGLAAYSTVDEGTQAAGNAGFSAGDLSFRLSAASRETGNYDTPIGEAPNSWTDLLTYAAGGSYIGDWGFSGLAVKHTEDNYGLLPEDPSEPGGHIEMEQTRVEARGDIRIDLGPFDRLDFGAQQSDYEHTEFEGDGEPGTQFTSEGWEARIEAHHRADQLRGALGLQLTDVDFAASGDEAFITPTNTRDAGVFAVERYDLGGWGLEGGVRFEQREIDNEGQGERSFDTTSASAGIFFRPAENWFTGATIARTERAPTAIELFSAGPHLATANYELGDPGLDRETALSIEGSVRYDAGPARFEINLYRIGFEDYIALVERGDVFWLDEVSGTSGFAPDASDPGVPAGADILPVFHFIQQDATFAGGEISGAAQLFEFNGFTFAADAALDIVRAEFDGGGHPPRIPPQSITLGLEAENDYWTGRIETIDTGEQDRLADFETQTEGYTTLNASLAFRPFGQGGAWTLRVDGRNLTDELGRVHSSFLKDELPLPGRNVRFTLTTSF
jgi:iron complex outermembrane receptor protein